MLYIRFYICLVGARKKHGLHDIQQPPPVSGDSWWQLEKTTSSYDGKQVICIWLNPC